MEVKNMDSTKETDNSFMAVMNKMKYIAEILCYTTCKPGCLELEYAMALDIAEAADVDIIDVLEFVKKLSTETKYTYEECIEYARKYFISGDYKIYSPDKYSLLVSQDCLFVIPSKDNEPTKLIKMA
jgi:hypothetical protein